MKNQYVNLELDKLELVKTRNIASSFTDMVVLLCKHQLRLTTTEITTVLGGDRWWVEKSIRRMLTSSVLKRYANSTKTTIPQRIINRLKDKTWKWSYRKIDLTRYRYCRRVLRIIDGYTLDLYEYSLIDFLTDNSINDCIRQSLLSKYWFGQGDKEKKTVKEADRKRAKVIERFTKLKLSYGKSLDPKQIRRWMGSKIELCKKYLHILKIWGGQIDDEKAVVEAIKWLNGEDLNTLGDFIRKYKSYTINKELKLKPLHLVLWQEYYKLKNKLWM